MRKVKIGDFLAVEWLDAMGTPGWNELRDIPTSCNCISIGIVCRTSKDFLEMARDVSDNGKDKVLGDVIAIPWGMVSKVEKIQ